MLDARARTFCVEGHHYALVVLEDLDEGSVTPVRGAARRRARRGRRTTTPGRADDPHARARASGAARVRLVPRRRARAAALHAPAGRSTAGVRDRRALGVLAPAAGRAGAVARLPAAAGRPGLRRRGLAEQTRAFIRARRDASEPPGEQVADFEEYTRLYREAWSDPDIRWLLATVPSTMIFDDHDVHDDWNISEAWVRRDAARRRGGRSGSSAPSCRTGSTSTSATSHRPSWPRSRCSRELQGDEDGGPRLRAFARDGRPRVGGEPLGVPPRLRPLAARRRRLARRARARRRPARHGRRRGVGTGSPSTRAATTTT